MVKHLQPESHTKSGKTLHRALKQWIKTHLEPTNKTNIAGDSKTIFQKFPRQQLKVAPVFEGDVGENHTEQRHWSIDDWHTQRERPWDGFAYRDTQVDGGGIVFQSSAAWRTVGLQLFKYNQTVVSVLRCYQCWRCCFKDKQITFRFLLSSIYEPHRTKQVYTLI